MRAAPRIDSGRIRLPDEGGWMFENADEVLSYVKDEGVEYVDVRFCDLPGVMQHFTMPASAFDEDAFSPA